MTLVELSTRVIPRILVCARVRGSGDAGDAGDDAGGTEYALFPREKLTMTATRRAKGVLFDDAAREEVRLRWAILPGRLPIRRLKVATRSCEQLIRVISGRGDTSRRIGVELRVYVQ